MARNCERSTDRGVLADWRSTNETQLKQFSSGVGLLFWGGVQRMAKWRVSSYAETSVAGVARNIGRAMKPWEGLARATSRKRARKSVEDYND